MFAIAMPPDEGGGADTIRVPRYVEHERLTLDDAVLPEVLERPDPAGRPVAVDEQARRSTPR